MLIALRMYSTTNRAMVFVGLMPPQDLKVNSEIRNETTNITADVSRMSQTDRKVPSS